jgi:hypothetical protein
MVFFKMKYIMQPTLTQANVITKALIYLTQALRGKNNQKGLEQINALNKLDAILNNELEIMPTETEKEDGAPAPRVNEQRVTFDKTVKAPTEKATGDTAPTPRVNEQPQWMRIEPIHAVMINKPIPKMPTPKMQNTLPTKKTMPKPSTTRELIRKHIERKTMARISSCSTHLRQMTRSIRQAQLIHDKETTRTSITDNSSDTQNIRKHGTSQQQTNLEDLLKD